jgi:hypothetical protein
MSSHPADLLTEITCLEHVEALLDDVQLYQLEVALLFVLRCKLVESTIISILIIIFCIALGFESYLNAVLTNFVFSGYLNPNDYKDCKCVYCNEYIWGYLYKINIAESLPFFAFLIASQLYPPHDCFKCFGKDPDRRYSVH